MGSSRMKLKKVYFFGICRDTQAFSWFLDVLKALEEEDLDHFIEIYQYLTGNLKTDQVENVIMGHSDDRDPITGKLTFPVSWITNIQFNQIQA